MAWQKEQQQQSSAASQYWSSLSKSRSSAAVLEKEQLERPRSRGGSVLRSANDIYHKDEKIEVPTIAPHDVHTNQAYSCSKSHRSLFHAFFDP